MQSDTEKETKTKLDMLLLLYGRQSSRYEARRVQRRPLYLLWKNAFQIPTDLPQWLLKIREKMLQILNKGKLIVKGGDFKDVVLLGNYAYTFTLVKENGEIELKSLKMVIDLINEKAPKWYHRRLNLPESFENDVYSTQINLVKDVNQLMTLIVSRAPLCANGTLRNYAERFATGTASEFKVKRFVQIVYEITKVARYLFNNEIFHLDIKPDNLFVCKGEKGEIYSFGDVDGLQFCEYSNCQNAFPAATIYYEPYHGMKFRGSDAFRGRDTYALMKTFLRLFFDLFYRGGNLKNKQNSLMRERMLDNDGLPDEPHYERDRAGTLVDIDTADTLLRFGRKYKRKDEKLRAVKEMMTLCATMMASIDNAFYNTSVYEKATINNNLRKLQTLAKNAGAKRAEGGTKSNIFDGLLPPFLKLDNDTVENVVSDGFEEMCWKGYRRVKGKRRYSKGSCRRKVKEQLKF